MHPTVYEAFELILAELSPEGPILEIGAIPSEHSLLNISAIADCERIGINLKKPSEHNGFRIVSGNSNDMAMFEDRSFGCVLSNATLEHDPFFWKTLEEIRRVLRPGGHAVLGVPGFVPEADFQNLAGWTENSVTAPELEFANATVTFKYHAAPYDYYRFSPQACMDVLFSGYRDVYFQTIMLPPRIITWGVRDG